jgi:hypothetical protein
MLGLAPPPVAGQAAGGGRFESGHPDRKPLAKAGGFFVYECLT